MALVKADIVALVKSKMDEQYGTSHPDFSAERDKYANVFADVLMDVLLTKFDITGQTNVVSGSSAGSYPTVITKA